MRALLYQPSQLPKPVSVHGFTLSEEMMVMVSGASNAATVLDCAPGLVDVLACGPSYIVYSVFDHEGETNLEAMRVLSELTGATFDLEHEDQILRGPILVVRADG
jgi:hypothetical protein